MNWFKIVKGVHQDCTLYAEYIMQGKLCEMPDWINHKLESRLLRENQQTQLCRLSHSKGRKQRGAK